MKQHLTKTLIILVLSLCSPLFNVQAQSKTSIRDVMEEISGQFDVRFVYDSSLGLDSPYTGRPIRHRSLEKSLETLFNGTEVQWSIEENGYIVLSRPKEAIALEENPEEEMRDTLTASKVVSDRNADRLRSSSTGLEKLDGKAFNKGFAVLSSPDVIKTLQTLPGVSSGTELLSGMYVHGGTGSDNLYLLDGVPLYQVSHLAGLFSSFNADIIDNVDFYKSGFPARFGGRMSSIVDISTTDGDMQEYHGLFSIGLLDGRLQAEGPIIKGKTSFNVAMRRSWVDVFSAPVLAIVNSRSKDYKTRMHYSFGDLNAKVTHLFAPENKLTAAFYYGHDSFDTGFDYIGQYEEGVLIPGTENLTDRDGIVLKWGNTLASLRWENRLTDCLKSDIKVYYTKFSCDTEYFSYYWMEDKESFYKSGSTENGGSGMRDLAAKADFLWTPSLMHKIRFGAVYENHRFTGDRSHEEYIYVNDTSDEKLHKSEDSDTSGQEISVYAEDNITLSDWFTADIGLRYVLFSVPGKTYNRLEPRVSLNFIPHKDISVKASYTEMNQFAHNLSTSNAELPTSIWMPSTAKVTPQHSREFAGGVYMNLPARLTLDIEGYYKTMQHLREYYGHSMLYPPMNIWENEYAEGEGLSYGAEATLGYNTEKTNISVAYTLSWTMRRFERLWQEWFPAWNDNRHKLTVSAVHKFNDRFDLYAAWNFHSGNRISIDPYRLGMSYIDTTFPFRGMYGISSSPNNIQMPAYHRLDVGMNFRKITKRGNESIWNLSLYNVYCRMNPITADIRKDDQGNVYGVGWGIIPIIPSFSYTLRF